MATIRNYEGTNFITGIRAIAVFLVYLIHSGGGGLREAGGIYYIFVDFGKYGVPMFFVISGFTIFHQLLTNNYSYAQFLKIRISRISIPYFPIILLMFLYINMGGEHFNPWANKFNAGAITLDNLLAHLTYLASFSLKYANTIIGVEWSLHIEIFFYVIIGYLIAKKILTARFNNLFIALLMALLLAVIFLYLTYINKLDRLLVHWMPFRYAWMFVLGGLALYFRNLVGASLAKKTINRLSDLSILLSVGCVFILLHLDFINNVNVINQSIFAVLTGLLIVFVRDHAGLSMLLNNRFMIWFGSISFSFYLLHYIVIKSELANGFFEDITALFFVNFVLTALVSQCWFMLFEVNLYKKAKAYIQRN